MKSPNIWIGIGDYGEAFLKRGSERYETLKLLSSDTALGAPILCHVDIDEETKREPSHGIAYLGSVDAARNKVFKIVEQKLHAGIRRGNERGRAFLFLFCHVDDLLEIPKIENAEHWLWQLLSRLKFTAGYVSLTVATEPDQEAIGEDRQDARSRLTAVSKALHQSGLSADGNHTLSLLSPACAKSIFDEDEPPSPSIDAMTMLFDLVCSTDCDPNDSSALSTLLRQERGATDWQPSCASFAVEAWGVNLQDMVRGVHEEISAQIVQSIESASETPGSDVPALPEFDVTYPESGEREETRKLSFGFKHDALEDPEVARRRLSEASRKLRDDLRRYWTSEADRDALDSHGPRVEAGRRLDTSIKWLYDLLNELWATGGYSAHEIATRLAHVRGTAAAQNTLTPESSSVAASDLGRLERSTHWRSLQQSLASLRAAVMRRPSLLPTVLTMFLILLAGGIVAVGALDFVNDQAATREIVSSLSLRLAIIVAVLVLVVIEPALRWVLVPARVIMRGVDSVNDARSEAKGAVDGAQKSFAIRAGEMLRQDLRKRFQTEVKKEEDLFEALASYSRDLEDMGKSNVPLDLGRRHEVANMWEKLDLKHREDYLIEPGKSKTWLRDGTDGLKDRFRGRFAPTSIEHLVGKGGEGWIEFQPAQFGAALDAFFADELLRPLVETKLIDDAAFSACQPVSHVLADTGVVIGRKTELTELFFHPDDEDRVGRDHDQNQLRAVLRRGDKVFAMTVATSLSIEHQVS